MVLSVSERTFTQEVLESPIPVLVNFWAPWCGLCRIIQPVLLQFQAYCGEPIKLVGVNADQNFKLSNSYRLTTLPTLILIEEGKVLRRLEGFRGSDELRRALEEIRLSYTDRRKTYTGERVGEGVWEPVSGGLGRPENWRVEALPPPNSCVGSGSSHTADWECRSSA